MAHEATINARLPESLKRGGSKVLEAQGVSPTQLIRSVYTYMEREQRIPECLDLGTDSKQQAIEKRRRIARSVAGTIALEEGFDVHQAREERIAAKYGELL